MTPLEEDLRNFALIYWERESEVDYDFSEKVPGATGEALNDIATAVAELMREVSEHSSSDKRKVSTRLDGQMQIVELAWNGEPLEIWRQQDIKERYMEGMKSDINTFAGGAISAAYRIGKWGGSIKIENFEDPIYTSRNVITLPLDFY